MTARGSSPIAFGRAQAEPAEASERPERPDIVLIMADQLVPMLTGAYGHPVA